MSIANSLWGAPRIHGELLKLGIDIGQTSVAKYMAKRRDPPSQGWRTFLRDHADGIAAMDLFVVPTISFRLLYGLLIMGHGRRQMVSCDCLRSSSIDGLGRRRRRQGMYQGSRCRRRGRHMAGHGKLGAAAGCVIGHHEANKPDPNNANAQAPAQK
jgi:hypothetical protein